MTIGEQVLIWFVMIGAPLIIIGIPVFYLMGGTDRFSLKPLQRIFEDIQLRESVGPGDVQFVYHTYRGFLAWVIQEEHRIIAPEADARLLLSRMLRFNLTWGLLCYGLIFVPFLAYGNFYAQKRSIDKQVKEFDAKRPYE